MSREPTVNGKATLGVWVSPAANPKDREVFFLFGGFPTPAEAEYARTGRGNLRRGPHHPAQRRGLPHADPDSPQRDGGNANSVGIAPFLLGAERDRLFSSTVPLTGEEKNP